MTENEQARGHLKTALSHLEAALAEVGKAGETEDTAELAAALGSVEFARRRTEKAVVSITRPAVPAAVNCPGCGGNGTALGSNPKVLRCEGCGGYYTREAITRAEGLALVNFNEWHTGRSKKGFERYFDFTIEGGLKPERIHGFFDLNSRRMTQSG